MGGGRFYFGRDGGAGARAGALVRYHVRENRKVTSIQFIRFDLNALGLLHTQGGVENAPHHLSNQIKSVCPRSSRSGAGVAPLRGKSLFADVAATHSSDQPPSIDSRNPFLAADLPDLRNPFFAAYLPDLHVRLPLGLIISTD